MTSRADWPIIHRAVNTEPEGPIFFTEHEWATIEATTARIYPSDDTPGAREAGVVRFIDRYLSGLDYVFASADGSGYLAMSGPAAAAWRARIAALQRTYRAGIRELDAIAHREFRNEFRNLGEDCQDRVLEILSGAPKPTDLVIPEGGTTHVQNVSDDGLPFFAALALHTRQGMFCDPVYGGNRDRVGWKVIGFPGPNSLAETRDCTYGHRDHFFEDEDWSELIPHLRRSG